MMLPLIATLAVIALVDGIQPYPAEADAAWRAKVAPAVLDAAQRGETDFLIVLSEQADLAGAAAISGKAEKGRWVHERLTEAASRTQGPLLVWLRATGVPHRPYWILNMVWGRGGSSVIEAIARRGEVARVAANPRVRADLPAVRPSAPAAPAGPAETIVFTGAPDVFWSQGFRGQGTVVGVADSGQEWDHPALKLAYRGWDGKEAVHDYNWHDAIHSGGGDCRADSPVPCDDNDHGTSTASVVVGDDGAGNQIGMAPQARWIGCRNMDLGVGTPATYAECFEFFLAPTDLDGENPRAELAPHAINNSWRCPPEEGCTDPLVLRAPVEALRAAGIAVVASAGNEGQQCGGVNAPPAIYDASITVGSTNVFGEVSSFSSRGPVTVDGSGRQKPDFLAPGENVRVAIRGNAYGEADGTSVAGPHMAGMIALMISARPCLAGEVDAMEELQRTSTFWFETSEECGGIPGDVVPNNTFGWGIIQAVLPPPDLCGTPLGGALAGLAGIGARCRNETTGAVVTIPLGGGRSWDCEAAGLTVGSGDTVTLLARGEALGAQAGARVNGMAGLLALCRNERTRQAVRIALGGGRAWDCGAAGLVVQAGDRVSLGARGTAE